MAFKVNIEANLAAMAQESGFADVKENETVLFRFAPPVDGRGLTFYRTVNHYKFKDEAGRGIALADLAEHGTDETGYEDYITKLSDVLLAAESSAHKAIGKAIKASSSFYAQGWEAYPLGEGQYKYSKIKRMRLPKTGAAEVMEVFKNLRALGEQTADDPERGQLILLSRSGTGFSTKYRAERSGQVVALADIIPDWEAQMHKDVYASLQLKVFKPEVQKKIAMLSYPDLPWKELEEKHGL